MERETTGKKKTSRLPMDGIRYFLQHFGKTPLQPTNLLHYATLNIHPAEIHQSFYCVLLGSKTPYSVSFFFHNNKLQFLLKTAMDQWTGAMELLDQCVFLSIPDEWWEVLGQKKPHWMRIKLFCLNRWKMHPQNHQSKECRLNYCYNSFPHAYRKFDNS